MPRRWIKKTHTKQALNIPLNKKFKVKLLITLWMDGVSIHTVTTKIQVSFLTELPDRKETAHEANGDF